MREIKFRLIKDGRVVGYEKHTQNKGDFRSSIFHSIESEDSEDYCWYNIVCKPKHIIDCDFKEQYTGVKNKNGIEIYEGDVVYSPNWKPSKMEVVFNRGGFCLKEDDESCYYPDIKYAEDMEIIHRTGEIYE